MNKIDFKKEDKPLYSPSAKQPSIVEVPSMPFLMIDGAGDPNNSEEFKQAVSALYSLSYALKFTLKKAQIADYSVAPLEGLWWVRQDTPFSYGDRSNWQWTLMLRQPEQVTAELVAAAVSQTAKKKDVPALPNVRFERYDEGTAAQIMHLGAFSEEPATIDKLHTFIREQGYHETLKHHEIYLTDFSRTAPEKLRTVLRHPVVK
ncbi:MAG: GyrI-like domain-containing protein [Anaerolineae bacterium]|nr:GyrI-like domain-containing protein [Anaerolineae bacterium]